MVNRFVEKGLIGFFVMATCHGFANYLTTDVGLPLSRRITQFWTNEIYLIAPFTMTAAATLVVEHFSNSDNAVDIGYNISLGIIALLTYAASRGAHRSRPRALFVAVLAAVVGIVVGALGAACGPCRAGRDGKSSPRPESGLEETQVERDERQRRPMLTMSRGQKWERMSTPTITATMATM